MYYWILIIFPGFFLPNLQILLQYHLLTTSTPSITRMTSDSPRFLIFFTIVSPKEVFERITVWISSGPSAQTGRILTSGIEFSFSYSTFQTTLIRETFGNLSFENKKKTYLMYGIPFPDLATFSLYFEAKVSPVKEVSLDSAQSTENKTAIASSPSSLLSDSSS